MEPAHVYGFAFYIDTSNELYKPQYVIFVEGLFEVETDRPSFKPSYIVVNDKSFTGKLICFRWKVGANLPVEKLQLDGLFILESELPAGYELLPLLNTHLEIELAENNAVGCNFSVQLAFPSQWGVKRHIRKSLYDKRGHLVENDMAKVRSYLSSRYDVGVPQGLLGRCGTCIPREYFYLYGEALFSQNWVENKYRFILRHFDVTDKISALIIALTFFINTRVRYTRDAFTVLGREYDFENFSDRTLLVRSGDCEDVAAWLLSAFCWIKDQGWCDDVLREYTPINILLRVASGTVEGVGGVIKSNQEQQETLDEYNVGGVHVTCLLLPTENLQALFAHKPIPSPQKEIYFAEGTAMVYPVFRRELFNEQASKYVLEYQKRVERDLGELLRGFPGATYGLLTRYIHKAIAGGKHILHTSMEIMLNRTFEKEFDSTIYLTVGKEPDGEYAYPITLESFFTGISEGKPISLTPVLPCTPADKEEYIEACALEPANVALLEYGKEVWGENNMEKVELWKCAYFTTSEEAPENQLDGVKLPEYVKKMKLTPSLYILVFAYYTS